MTQPKYLWLDLETTGLDPTKHRILEFAVIVTGADLRTIEQAGGVLRFDLDAWDRVAPAEHFGVIDDFVRDMHKKNGLWDACQDGLITPEAMQEFLLGLVDDNAPWADGKPILAGSTPHFDRSFLREHCPELDAKLHYRHFDVSTLKMALRDRGERFAEPVSNHRASTDVEHSLNFARLCRVTH